MQRIPVRRRVVLSQVEAGHSLPSNRKVKNEWRYTSNPPNAFMVWCLSAGKTSPFDRYEILYINVHGLNKTNSTNRNELSGYN
jgi:hypothetical protein